MTARKQPIRLAKRLLCLFAALAVISDQSNASMLTVTCDDPKGFHIYYGEKMLQDSPGFHEDTRRVEKFGSKPTFLIESARPDRMLVIWGSGVTEEIPELIRKWFPTKTEEAQIILQNEDQVTAIYTYSEGRVEMYSLYPKFEYGVFTTHTESGPKDEVMAWIYWAKCKFTK